MDIAALPAGSKVTGARQAVERIRPRDTVCTSGFVGTGTPEELIRALERGCTTNLSIRLPFEPCAGSRSRRGGG